MDDYENDDRKEQPNDDDREYNAASGEDEVPFHIPRD